MNSFYFWKWLQFTFQSLLSKERTKQAFFSSVIKSQKTKLELWKWLDGLFKSFIFCWLCEILCGILWQQLSYRSIILLYYLITITQRWEMVNHKSSEDSYFQKMTKREKIHSAGYGWCFEQKITARRQLKPLHEETFYSSFSLAPL